MKQFNLEEYLANPERKVVTRKGKPVELITTKGREPYVIIGYIDYETPTLFPTVWTKEGYFNELGLGESFDPLFGDFDLFFADEEKEPKWYRAKAGTRLSSEAVIIYDTDPEPRLGKVMVNDGRYMLVKELEELPEE